MANIRKPASVHKLEGTYRPDRHGPLDEELIIEEPIGAPPNHLDVHAQTEWHRIVRLMNDGGVLRATDRTVLTLYCCLHSEQLRHGDQFSNARISSLRGCMGDLGLTPVARAKIRASAPGAKKGSGFDSI